VLVLPASETDPYAGFRRTLKTLERRALTLWRLTQESQDFVLLTARAIARKMVAPEEVKRLGTFVGRESQSSPDELVDKLFCHRLQTGRPSRRDWRVFHARRHRGCLAAGTRSARAYRIFGDTIDSIREFDPETQLSYWPDKCHGTAAYARAQG